MKKVNLMTKIVAKKIDNFTNNITIFTFNSHSTSLFADCSLNSSCKSIMEYVVKCAQKPSEYISSHDKSMKVEAKCQNCKIRCRHFARNCRTMELLSMWLFFL